MMAQKNITLGLTLAGLAMLAAACTKPAKVEVTNGCGQTIVFAHFQEDSYAPEFRDEMFAKVEWITMEQGDSTKIEIDAASQPTAMFTVVAEEAPQIWDPVIADVQLEDPEDWHKGTIELTGDLCG